MRITKGIITTADGKTYPIEVMESDEGYSTYLCEVDPVLGGFTPQERDLWIAVPPPADPSPATDWPR